MLGINITIYGSHGTYNYLLPYMVRHVITCTYNNCYLLQTNSFSFFPDILGYRSPVGAWTFDIIRVMKVKLI